MNELLLKLFIAAALLDFGHALLSPEKLTTSSGLERIDQATREVLKIDWKPISVFPEESARLHKSPQKKIKRSKMNSKKR